jgi:hypothetical protein
MDAELFMTTHEAMRMDAELFMATHKVLLLQ